MRSVKIGMAPEHAVARLNHRVAVVFTFELVKMIWPSFI
jgi:hypothetical protein